MIAKLIPLALVAMLAACSSTGSQPAAQAPQDGGTPAASAGSAGSALGGECNAEPVQNLVGTKLTPAVTQDARTQSGSTYTRVLRPGQMMTMEYNAERLTLILDEQDVITKLHCG